MSRHFQPVILSIFALLVVWPLGAGELKVLKNIQYKDGGQYERERCKLDLYLPGGKTDFPILVWFHGGGMTSNSKDEEEAVRVGRRMAKEGIGTAVVNYRLSPMAKYPSYIEDAAASVAWSLRHVGGYGGDPNAVFAGGHSAGGYLAAMVVMDPRYLKGHGAGVADVAGVIPVSGQMDSHSTVRAERGIERSVQVIDATAPLHHVRPGLPPMLILAGGEDLPGRSEINQRFHEALTAAGNRDAGFVEVPGRTHTSIVFEMDDPNDEVVQIMLSFINRVTARRGR